MSYGYANYDDVLTQMRDHGLMVETIAVDTSRQQRCHTADNQREKKGWYHLSSITINYNSYIIGAYGIWSGADNGKQIVTLAKQERDSLTQEQREAQKALHKEAQRKAESERKRQADKAAEKAKATWHKCPTEGSSPYLTRKQVGAHGVRFGNQGTLVVPITDESDTIRGLQLILPKDHPRAVKNGRDKDFWPYGVVTSGTWHLIGGHPKDILLIAEGYATGASLHEATGHPVAVVWSANNIGPACKALRKKYQRPRFLICADDDWIQKCTNCGEYTPVTSGDCIRCQQPHRQKNAGVSCAESAALSVNGAWVKPQFTIQRPDNKKGPTDFNDLHCLESLQQVVQQIDGKLTALGWLKEPLRGDTSQGGGETRSVLKSMLTIDEAIERFSLVYGGKATMFDKQEHMLVPKADVLDILPEHGWRDMRAHKTVVRLDEVGFDPAGTDKRILCNLYGGWPTVPKQGDCSKLLELLRYLCSEETNADAVFDWVIKWLAYPIQHPGAKMQTALVFHGPQGTGKNLFFESIMAIYGEYGRIVDQAAIEDKFNDWASRKLFMIADEVVARTELYHVKNKLKSFVTGEWIRINPKNVSAHDEKNHVNLVFLSNEAKPLVLEDDDRRYLIIHTPEKLPEEFYKSVRKELDNGGIAALHHHLKTLDISGFEVFTKPIKTQAKAKLIEASLGTVQAFALAWYQGEIDKAPFCPCGSQHLYITYQRYCAATGNSKPRNQADFNADIGHLPGWKVGTATTIDPITGTPKSRKMVIPDVKLIKEYAKGEKLNGHWLHDCFETFSIAGGFSL